MTSSESPPFDSLPLIKDGPQGNAWGRFGANDQLGMLNLLTPKTTKAAAQEIVEGIRISTDYALDKFSIPSFGRAPFQHDIRSKEPRTVNDDTLTFNTQSSSQWDGFRHYAYQDRKLFFNGRDQKCISTTTENGIHIWVENGGIIGRGVLLDYCSWAESRGTKSAALETTAISLSELKEVAKAQGVSFQKGDILFVRSGYMKAFDALSSEQVKEQVSKPDPKQPNPPSIGVQSCRETLEWIWSSGFAAVAGDMPAFEAWPCQDKAYWMHEWLLAGWGLPIGELFDLERLAVECRRLNKWSFFFSSVPLKVPGGVASPPNGVAIL